MSPALPSFRAWLDARCAAAAGEPGQKSPETSRTFLEFRGRRWSYADLARITDAIAAALHARGVAPGDRVVITLGNSPEHLFAWLGAAKLGATVAPLHAQWTPTEVARALAQLRPKLVVGELSLLEQEEAKDKAKTSIEGKDEGKARQQGPEAKASIEGKGGDKAEQQGQEAKAFIEGKDQDTPEQQDQEAKTSIEWKNQDWSELRDRARAESQRLADSRETQAVAASAALRTALSVSKSLPFPSMEAFPPLPSPSKKDSLSLFSSSSSSPPFHSMEVSASSSVPHFGRGEIARLMDSGSSPFPEVAKTPAEAPAELLFTSGTTGMPKAAVQSYRSMMLTGEAFADWLRLGPGDRLFTCLPLAHINARFYSTMGALAAGATLVLEEKFSASAFWSWMAESGATVVNTIGAMLRILLQAPPSAAERAHRLRIVYTSPALGDELHRQFEARFGVRLVVGYGMTECTFGFIHPVGLPLDSADRHLDSMGRPRRHPDPAWPTGWRLVDPAAGLDLHPAPNPGLEGVPASSPPAVSAASGEIWLSGPTLFSGYFENPEATASVLSEDGGAQWLRTGDLAERDAGGWWTFVGRTKEMIRRRGENVSPLEIETVLMSHPAVAEAAVLGIPSALGEEEIAAFVVVRSGMSIDEPALRDHCAAHLAKFKVPSEWRFVDALPRTSTNRVAKGELKALRSAPRPR